MLQLLWLYQLRSLQCCKMFCTYGTFLCTFVYSCRLISSISPNENIKEHILIYVTMTYFNVQDTYFIQEEILLQVNNEWWVRIDRENVRVCLNTILHRWFCKIFIEYFLQDQHNMKRSTMIHSFHCSLLSEFSLLHVLT